MLINFLVAHFEQRYNERRTDQFRAFKYLGQKKIQLIKVLQKCKTKQEVVSHEPLKNITYIIIQMLKFICSDFLKNRKIEEVINAFNSIIFYLQFFITLLQNSAQPIK